jgi:hypothetical protein
MLFSEYKTADAAELRRNVAGCGQAEIYVRDGDDGAVVISEAKEAGKLPAAKKFVSRFSGGRFGDAGGPWLFHVGLWTPSDYRDEFLAWYEVEHLPMLLECPVWDGCRFVEEAAQDGCQFHALHQFSDAKALDSEERRRSRSTPWFNRLSKNDWFDGAFKRTLYRRVSHP